MHAFRFTRWLQPMPLLAAPVVTAGLIACAACLTAAVVWLGVNLWLLPQVLVYASSASLQQESSPVVAPFSQTISYVFGQPRKVIKSEPLPAQVIPLAQANIKVFGLVYSPHHEVGAVMLAVGGGPQKLYRSGDQLKSSLRLVSIQADSLLLEQHGQLRQLALFIDKDALLSQHQPKNLPANDLQVSQLLLRVVLRQPDQLRQYFRVRTVWENSLVQGYRVYAGPQPEIFQASGLRAGDLITHVDGKPVGDLNLASLMKSSILARDSVPVTLVRDGIENTFILKVQ